MLSLARACLPQGFSRIINTVSCYSCCQLFNCGCLITGGELAPGLSQTPACTCSRIWFSSQTVSSQMALISIMLSLQKEYLSVTSRQTGIGFSRCLLLTQWILLQIRGRAHRIYLAVDCTFPGFEMLLAMQYCRRHHDPLCHVTRSLFHLPSPNVSGKDAVQSTNS